MILGEVLSIFFGGGPVLEKEVSYFFTKITGSIS